MTRGRLPLEIEESGLLLFHWAELTGMRGTVGRTESS